jgi:thiosulfate/3-mercaptopyruvate sulfurtransferase
MRSRLQLLVFGLAFAILAGMMGGANALAQDSAEHAYAHPEWFADVRWLQDRLGDDALAVVALTPAEEFAAGHIPGAAQIDWPALEIVETSDASLANWRTEVEAILTGLGIERDDSVVVYDGGTFYAARLWWILHQLGHEDVRVLNGGLEAWVAEKGELETGESTVAPAVVPYAGDPNEEALVSIAEAEAALDRDDVIFVDARRFEDEYTVGHIPGAISVPFLANAEEEGPKYWKPAAELRDMYEDAGVNSDRHVIAYCTTGVRSAVTYFTLRQIGYDAALFTGSFAEWSSDPSRPVTTGATP